MFKKLILIYLCLLTVFLSELLPSLASTNSTRVIFCDVSQGDGMLLTQGSFQLLVDAGPDNKILSCLDKYLPIFDRTIELAIITHPHGDHFGGMIDILKSYRVQNMIIDDFVGDEDLYFEFYNLLMDKIEKNELKVISSAEISALRISDDLLLEVLFSKAKSLPGNIFEIRLTDQQLSALKTEFDRIESNLNNVSIGVNLQIEDKMLTLTGDLESEGELAMVRSGLLGKVDVLKIPHHGSKTSSLPQFLELLSPEISIISLGANNMYKHPNVEVLERLENLGTNVYRTDEQGDVVLEFKHGEIEVSGEK